MTKRIALAAACLAAVGTGYATNPEPFQQVVGVAARFGLRVWESVEANPIPVTLAVVTFLLTVVYHTGKGKTLRESVEAAAMRDGPPSPPRKEPDEPENPVVIRAKARATRTQLLVDQIGIENRIRKLPEELTRAEKDACYTEQTLADARRLVAEKQRAHDEAVAKLEALRYEQAEADAELEEIASELEKLAGLV